MCQSPFLTPDQLAQQKWLADADDLDRLRELVRKAFEEQNPCRGCAYSVRAQNFSDKARKAVFAELRDAGWTIRNGGQTDLPGEFFIQAAQSTYPL